MQTEYHVNGAVFQDSVDLLDAARTTYVDAYSFNGNLYPSLQEAEQAQARYSN